MIIDAFADGLLMRGNTDFHRPSFGSKTDEELLALRARYKKFEKVIFEQSWVPASLDRFQETCAALSLALDRATEQKDLDVVYCPWFLEAFTTLSSRLIKIPKSISSEEEYNKIRENVIEIVGGTSGAFACFAYYLVRYVSAVCPNAENSPGNLIRTAMDELACFFNIENKEDKEMFKKTALHLLYPNDNLGFPEFKKITRKLSQACLTQAWPEAIQTEEDKPVLISNITNEELCSLCGVDVPPHEEKEKIDARAEAVRAIESMKRASEDAEHFFAHPEWFKQPGPLIAMWRICRRAGTIGKKAKEYRKYYHNKGGKRPVIFLSEDISGSKKDDLVPLIEAFVYEFSSSLSTLASAKYTLNDLICGMCGLYDSFDPMFYFLNKLPHDRYLNAARRTFSEWYDILAGIIREQIDPVAGVIKLVEKNHVLCDKLRAASDILNEKESQIEECMSIGVSVSVGTVPDFEAGQKGCHKRPVAYDLTEESIEKIITGVAGSIREKPLPARVEELSPKATSQIKGAVHAKMPERGYFSGPILCALFEVSENTPANWVKGKGTPEGFIEAYRKRDRAAMQDCAEKYKASRKLADAMNTKHVKHGISEEEIFKEGGNPWGKPQ